MSESINTTAHKAVTKTTHRDSFDAPTAREESLPNGVRKTNNGHLITPDMGADSFETQSNSFNDPPLYPSLKNPNVFDSQRDLTPPSTRGALTAEMPLRSPSPTRNDSISKSPKDTWYTAGITPYSNAIVKRFNEDPRGLLRECLADEKRRRDARIAKSNSSAQGKVGKTSGKANVQAKSKTSAAEDTGKLSTSIGSNTKASKSKRSRPDTTAPAEMMTTRGSKRRFEEQEYSQSASTSPSNVAIDSPPSQAENTYETPLPAEIPAAEISASAPVTHTAKRVKTLTPSPSLAAIKPASTPKKTSTIRKKADAMPKKKGSEKQKEVGSHQRFANTIRAHLNQRCPENAIIDWTLPNGEILKCTRTACANLYEDAWMPDTGTLDQPDAEDMYDLFPTKRGTTKDGKAAEKPVKKPRDFFQSQNDPCLQFVHPKEAALAAAINWKTLHEYITQKRRLFLGYAEMARQGYGEPKTAHAQKIANCDVNKAGDMHKAFIRWGWLESIPQAYINRRLTSRTPDGKLVEMEEIPCGISE